MPFDVLSALPGLLALALAIWCAFYVVRSRSRVEKLGLDSHEHAKTALDAQHRTEALLKQIQALNNSSQPKRMEPYRRL